MNEKKILKEIDKIYVEGQDQFRGWFNSSLLLSTIVKNKSPFQKVLSHGFVVDENGKKMSKSLGNVINPDELLEKFNIDTIRLWVASSNFTKEIKISFKIMEKIEENYLKIRNSIRYILGNINLANLSMIKEIENLSLENLYILSEANDLRLKCEEKYKEYDFASICSSIVNFLVNQLSSFFFEINKDILYCNHINSEERKETITSFYYILNWILEIIVPIFPYLSEEIYNSIPNDFKFSNEKSVHLIMDFPRIFFSEKIKKEIEVMNNFFFPLRKEVHKMLEELKKKEIIKISDELNIIIFLKKEKEYSVKDLNKINLKKLLIVSQIEVKEIKEKENYNDYLIIKEFDNWWIFMKKTKEEKCKRCKKYKNIKKFELCERCEKVINNM